MPSILTLETSTEVASLALVIEGELIAEKQLLSDRKHNAMLFEPMRELIDILGKARLDAVFVGTGPGSYSGTRVGIAAAQGAALVSRCKVAAIPSLLATPEAVAGKECLAIGDARRGSFWTAKIRSGSLIQAPRLTDEAGLNAAILEAQHNQVCIFSMDGLRDDVFPQLFPTASGVWNAWQIATAQQQFEWSNALPQPIYLAPPHITPSKKVAFGQSSHSGLNI